MRADARLGRMLPIYLIVLAAFALRMFGLDAARTYHDMGEPHSLGIGIVESIQAGRPLSELPSLSLLSGIRIPNPVGASYFWALVTVIDRSPYTAAAISVMLNVLSLAMLYDLARRLFGRTTGLAASALMAASLWSIFLSRGAWIQGQLEFGAICAAWLVLIGLKEQRPRRVLLGFVFAAWMAQTYLAAIGVFVQILAASAAMLAACAALRARLLRPVLTGGVICLLSIGLYAAILFQKQPTAIQDVLSGVNKSAEEPLSFPNPFGLHLDQIGLRNTLQVTSGGDFEKSLWADFAAPSTIPYDAANETRAKLIEVALGIGALAAAWRVVRRGPDAGWHRVALIWFGLPMTASFVLTLAAHRFDASRQYMVMTQPMGYVLAALPLGLLAQHKPARGWKAGPIALAGAGAAMIAISGLSMRSYIADVFAHPFLLGNIDFAPMRIQARMGAIWREKCAEITQPQRELQVASVFQTRQHIRRSASQDSPIGNVWEVRAAGGTCVTKSSAEYAPLYAEKFSETVGPGAILNTYRSKPIDETALVRETAGAGFKPLTLNLNWTLISQNSPPAARPGDILTATHIWRIDGLPSEPYAGYAEWYYPMFVHLTGPDGKRIVLLENGPAVQGKLWRPGDYVLSTVWFSLPKDLPAGNYTLEFSLFDPNKKRNAVYFDPANSTEPILAVRRALAVTP